MSVYFKRGCCFAFGFIAVLITSIITPNFAYAESDFPSKPIKLIVPFSAGGPTDVTARIFSKAISEELGQAVVVENRPGAGGTLGGTIAARATPDGYTLLWGGTSTMAVAPTLYKSLPYDPLTSFQPVSRAVQGPLVLVVNTKLPVKSVTELIAYAKKYPGKINYGSAGLGSIIHLTGEMFRARAGIDIVHVPYKGNGYVMTDLSAGVVQMAFIALGHILPHLRDGNLRALAITSMTRNPLAPGIPTMNESGLADFESEEWFGLMAPSGIPANALARLNIAFRKISASDDIRRSVAALGYQSVDESPQHFSIAIKDGAEKWQGVISNAGIEQQ